MKRLRFLIPVSLLILLAAATRLPLLGAESLWFDEGWSAFAASQPSLVAAANADATNPPLYYVLLNAHAALLGTSEFTLRLFSLWCGLLLVAVVTAIVVRAGAGQRASVWSAAACALLPLLWWASREARMYTLLALLAALATLGVVLLLCGHARWPVWTLTLGAQLALLYAHNTGPVAVVWLNVLIVGIWLLRRRANNPPWRTWIAGQVVVLLLWSPYFMTRFLALSSANSALQQSSAVSVDFIILLWRAFWQTPWERLIASLASPVVWAAFGVAVAAAIPLRERLARVTLVSALLWVTGIVIGLLILGNEMHGRYLVVVTPFVCMLLGLVIARFRLRAVRFALGGMLMILFVWNAVDNAALFPHKDDARAMVQHYRDTLGANDSVVAWSYADRYELAYYWDRLQPAARRITLPEGADLADVLPLLPTSGRVALNVWYTQRADYRGMMDCLLRASSAGEPDSFSVQGMTSLAYQIDGLAVPDRADVQLEVQVDGTGVAAVMQAASVGSSTADRAQCLPVTLTLTQPLAVDLRVQVTALNVFGREIAGANGVFATADQRTTSMSSVGERLTAFPVLALPTGTAPGDYAIRMRIYDDSSRPNGYALQSARETIVGPYWQRGTWNVVPGAVWDVDAPQDLPVRVDLPVGDLLLLAHDAEGGSLRTGDALSVLLLWTGDGPLPPLSLDSEASDWSIDLPTLVGEHDHLTHEWRQVIVPIDAPAGTAWLRLPDGTPLASYQLASAPFATDIPDRATPLAASFSAAGDLAAFVMPGTLTLDQPPQVTLYWRARASTEAPLTVFVQLLNTDGQVIAQSDAQPAQGTRPTTGWRSGEIIADDHMLTYNALAHPGPVRLIAGLYDAATGMRVLLDSGADAAQVAELTLTE